MEILSYRGRIIVKKRYLSILMIVFLIQFSVLTSASAFSLGDIGKFLDKVSGSLDRVSASLDKAVGGPTEENLKVIDKSKKTAPETNALFGKWETSWEKTMGAKTHESLRKDPGFLNDRKYLAQVARVARPLVKQVERKDLTYHFAVLNQKEVNAFAAPGGYIFVTKGLMDMIDSDDELAGVIGHELGHVNKRHSVKAAEKKGLMAVLVAGLALNKKTRKYAKYAAIASYFADLKFSRNDEYQADACAVKYTAAAGFNPRGLLSFFDKINNDSKSSKITKYFSDHPPTSDRIKAVEKQISKLDKSYPPVKQTQAQNTQITNNYGSKHGTSQQHVRNTNAQVHSVAKPTSNQLKVAYESYLYYKQLYQYKVQQQAPTSEILDAFNKYQAAKKQYVMLKRAAGY